MKRILIVLSIVMLLFPFQQVQAETANINDYKEFDSFMKRYHEHTTELTYFINASYNSNDYYYKENFQIFRDIVNQVYDTNKSEFLTSYLDSSEELFSKPIALIGVANDLRRLVWEKFKGIFKSDEVELEFDIAPNNGVYTLPAGYYFEKTRGTNVGANLGTSMWLSNAKFSSGSSCYYHYLNVGNYAIAGVAQSNCADYTPGTSLEGINEIFAKPFSYAVAMEFLDYFGLQQAFVVKKEGQVEPVEPIRTMPIINNIINGLNTNGYNQDYSPQVQPMLVCPSEVIDLTYETGVFKTLSGDVVTIQENETANYLQEICNLDFKFPEIYYHDETGKIIVGGEDITVPASLPSEGFDNGLVEYVRNSYNYATSVISSGVNGLKSIVAGTTGLVTFTGSLFGFLPPEILTLFIGGFSIALGLWVFKK